MIRFGSLLTDGVLDDNVLQVKFGDPTLVAWEPGEDMEETGDSMYCRCPLCGDGHSIYGGNLWGTTPCCFNEENATRIESLVAGRLLAGDSPENVFRLLSALVPVAIQDYVAFIASLLEPGRFGPRVCAKYKAYVQGLMPSAANGRVQVIAGVLHPDGSFSIVERLNQRRRHLLLNCDEVEIIRNALSEVPGRLIAQQRSVGHPAGSHPTLEGSEKGEQ